jgi:hypothetical protein
MLAVTPSRRACAADFSSLLIVPLHASYRPRSYSGASHLGRPCDACVAPLEPPPSPPSMAGARAGTAALAPRGGHAPRILRCRRWRASDPVEKRQCIPRTQILKFRGLHGQRLTLRHTLSRGHSPDGVSLLAELSLAWFSQAVVRTTPRLRHDPARRHQMLQGAELLGRLGLFGRQQ